jgi:hypothetical protein
MLDKVYLMLHDSRTIRASVVMQVKPRGSELSSMLPLSSQRIEIVVLYRHDHSHMPSTDKRYQFRQFVCVIHPHPIPRKDWGTSSPLNLPTNQ